MTVKTKQPKGNEMSGRAVVGRIVFSFDAKVLKVIDLNEDSMKPDKKIKIVKSGLDEVLKENKMKANQKYDIRVDIERFPSTTFLSSTHVNSADVR